MNMTGFERLMRTLRGLATAYNVSIEIDNHGYFVRRRVGHLEMIKNIPLDTITNEIEFEEFLKLYNKWWKEIIDGNSNKSECSDLSGMQSDDA